MVTQAEFYVLFTMFCFSVTSDSIDKSLRQIIKLRTYLQWHDPKEDKKGSNEKALEAFHRRLRYALNAKMDSGQQHAVSETAEQQDEAKMMMLSSDEKERERKQG